MNLLEISGSRVALTTASLNRGMFSMDVSNTFRPEDEALSFRERSQVQIHRLLFLLGAFFCLFFIPLYRIASPGAFNPIWTWVAISGLLAGVFGASYLFKSVRRSFALWVWAAIAVVMGWFIFITAQNDFSSNYEIGLLLLHAIFTVVAGLGARSVRPVFWFASANLAATIGAVLSRAASFVGEAVLLGSMTTVSLLVGIVLQRLILTRQEVEEQESRLRGLANSVPGVVFQFHARPDGTRGSSFVSEHAREVLGISAEPVGFAERVAERVPAPHRREALQSIENAVDNHASWQIEVPFETPSGERIWLLCASAPEVREDEVVYNGVLLDISDRKQAEHKLRKAKKAAEEASQVKTAMLANMSHEVRTPLTSIIGFSEILEDELEGNLEGFARRAHESSQHLLETLESVLQLSKLEAGAATLDREEMSIRAVVQETVALLDPRAEEKAITIETECPPEPVTGFWNENAIHRITRNLLENAIKFTPERGRVEVRVEREAGWAALEVEDTGIGIQEESVPHVFQAFRQEYEGINREYQGSGLGLSIVNHLVEEHGGTIELETEKGEGTCFTVRLPITREEESVPPQTEAP